MSDTVMSPAALRGAASGKALVPLCLALALGACALGPARGVHPAPLDGAAVGLTQAVAPNVSDRWWQTFDDPQLNELMARATRSNPSLAEVLARLQQATAEEHRTAGALAPQVSASARVQREQFSGRYIYPPPYAGATVWDGQLSLVLSWDLDFWGRQRALVHAADNRIQAASFDASAARLAVESALVTAYLEFDRSIALAEISAQMQANRVKAAELTSRRVAAGIDAHGELEAAAAPVPEARVDVRKSQARIEVLRHQLAALSGQGANAYAAIARPRLNLAGGLPLPEELPGDLLRRRPDVQAALARVRAADAGAEAARLARYPDISLNALAGTAGLHLSDLLSLPAHTYGVGPQLLLPVFDAGQLRARYLAAGSELDAAIAAYDGAVLNAVRETGDQLSLVRALSAEHLDAQQQLDHLSAAYRIAQERRQAGLSAEQTVLDAELRVLAARAGLLATQTLEAQARVGLLVALGGADAAREPPVSSAATAAKAGTP